MHNGRAVLLCGDSAKLLKSVKDNYVDLTVTSPPYDDLRQYNGFSFDFETIANELFRVTKIGGVVVWVVADQTKDFAESLTSFKQAIYFSSICGFKLLDTMIYEKTSYAPAYPTMRRYAPVTEFMFVFSKGKPNTFNALTESKSIHSIKGVTSSSFRQNDGTIIVDNHVDRSSSVKAKTNLWRYSPGNDTDKLKFKHPATFPDQLVLDHILSWSNVNDVVLDPMMGSGTTGKMALKNNRKFIGIECSEQYFDDIAVPRLTQCIIEPQNVAA